MVLLLILITVPVLQSWTGIDDLLSMIALFYLANFEFLWAVLIRRRYAQFVTLLVSTEGITYASDEGSYLKHFLGLPLYLLSSWLPSFLDSVVFSALYICVCANTFVTVSSKTPGNGRECAQRVRLCRSEVRSYTSGYCSVFLSLVLVFTKFFHSVAVLFFIS